MGPRSRPLRTVRVCNAAQVAGNGALRCLRPRSGCGGTASGADRPPQTRPPRGGGRGGGPDPRTDRYERNIGSSGRAPTRSRARSSVGEHSPYKRGVAGSKPAAPTPAPSLCEVRPVLAGQESRDLSGQWADPNYVGTALTVQTAIGFLLSVFTIQLLPVL